MMMMMMMMMMMIKCSGTSCSSVAYKCDSNNTSYIAGNHIHIVSFTYYLMFNSLETFLRYSCDLWEWLLSWSMSDHKHLMKCVPLWLYYLIILVYMAAVSYKILTEAVVVIVTALRHITLSETKSQPLPSLPHLVHYLLVILALDAMYFELLAVSLNKPYINKIMSHLKFLCLCAVVLCHIPEEHNSAPHHCKNLRSQNIMVLWILKISRFTLHPIIYSEFFLNPTFLGIYIFIFHFRSQINPLTALFSVNYYWPRGHTHLTLNITLHSQKGQHCPTHMHLKQK
jgi:hypothetical protein